MRVRRLTYSAFAALTAAPLAVLFVAAITAAPRSEPVFSNIERGELEIDHHHRIARFELDLTDELLARSTSDAGSGFEPAFAADAFESPASELAVAEFAAYEEIRADRHGSIRAAEQYARNRTRETDPRLDRGLREANQPPSNSRGIQAGGSAVTASGGSTNLLLPKSTGPMHTLAALSDHIAHAQGVRVAAVVQLFYFAFRNGYAVHSVSVSLDSLESFSAARNRTPRGVFFTGALS